MSIQRDGDMKESKMQKIGQGRSVEMTATTDNADTTTTPGVVDFSETDDSTIAEPTEKSICDEKNKSTTEVESFAGSTLTRSSEVADDSEASDVNDDSTSLSAVETVDNQSCVSQDEKTVDIETETCGYDNATTEGEKAIYTQEDLDRLTEEAYLRGKNEAVEARIVADSAMRSNESLRNSTFAPYIIGRPSVWK